MRAQGKGDFLHELFRSRALGSHEIWNGQQRVQFVRLDRGAQPLERGARRQRELFRRGDVADEGQQVGEIALGTCDEQWALLLVRAGDHVAEHRLGVLSLPRDAERHREDP